MTLLVELLGGPGTGKSTLAANVFAECKMRGVNIELVHEVAKDHTWERNRSRLEYQPLIAASQMWAVDRLTDQVDVVIQDTSILYSVIYGTGRWRRQSFLDWLVDDYKSRDVWTIFLERSEAIPYSPHGRSESLAKSQGKDRKILKMLDEARIPFDTYPAGGVFTLDSIVNGIEKRIA